MQQNDTLKEQLKQIQLNFEAKQSLFSNLQTLPESELEKLYHSGELKNVKQKWQKELEIHFEAKDDEQRAQLVEFNNQNKEFFDKIEEFMHILDDWTEEKLHFDENGQKTAAAANKPKRPPRVGIEMFKNQNQAPEIESPFRRKKTGLQKLNVKDSLGTVEPIAESKELQQKLEKQFEIVMKNFSKRKADFEQLKNKPPAAKTDMYHSGALQSLTKDWQKELEL